MWKVKAAELGRYIYGDPDSVRGCGSDRHAGKRVTSDRVFQDSLESPSISRLALLYRPSRSS
jgi:hypothetical protein